MAEMFKHRKSSSKRTVVIAHTGHLLHEGEVMIPFATKTMGSHLTEYFKDQYKFIGVIAKELEIARWWTGEQLPSISSTSLEADIISLDLGSVLVDLNRASLGQFFEVMGIPRVNIRRHFDGIFVLPSTRAMTDVEGVWHP